MQGDSPIPLAAATSHDTQDLPCTSNLVPLEVNQIPERLGEVPLYLSPLQVASVSPICLQVKFGAMKSFSGGAQSDCSTSGHAVAIHGTLC